MFIPQKGNSVVSFKDNFKFPALGFSVESPCQIYLLFIFSYRRVVSGSKDGDVRVWDVVLTQCIRTLTSHTASVTSVRWGGSGETYR